MPPKKIKTIMKMRGKLLNQKKVEKRDRESMHSKLWAKCSKTKFAGYDKVLFAAQLTVLQHNFGYEDGSVLSLLHIPSSKHSLEIEKKFESRRCRPTPPKRRKKNPKKDADYSAGGF